MTPEKANKSIAKFMGTNYLEWPNGAKTIGDGRLYTTSLDELFPVLEKLEWELKITWLPYNGCIFYFKNTRRGPEFKEIHHACSDTFDFKENLTIAIAIAIEADKP